MCVVCGNIADTSTTAATVSAFLLSVSPLAGLYFYRLYRLLGIAQQMKKKHAHWRIGGLLAIYNSVLYILFGLLFYVLIQYTQYWVIPLILPTTVFTVFWIWFFWTILHPQYQMSLFRLSVTAFCGGAIFIVPLILGSSAISSTQQGSYYIHNSFLLYGVLYSIILYSLLLLVAYSTRMVYRHKIKHI